MDHGVRRFAVAGYSFRNQYWTDFKRLSLIQIWTQKDGKLEPRLKKSWYQPPHIGFYQF